MNYDNLALKEVLELMGYRMIFIFIPFSFMLTIIFFQFLDTLGIKYPTKVKFKSYFYIYSFVTCLHTILHSF